MRRGPPVHGKRQPRQRQWGSKPQVHCLVWSWTREPSGEAAFHLCGGEPREGFELGREKANFAFGKFTWAAV